MEVEKVIKSDPDVIRAVVMKPPGLAGDAETIYDPDTNEVRLINGVAYHVYDYIAHHSGLKFKIN